MSQIVIGPVTMDFGWNIMGFNPFCRFRVNNYPLDKVIVVCREGEEYIWEDIATDFEIIEANYSTDRWFINSKLPKVPRKMARRLGMKCRAPGNKRVSPQKRYTCCHLRQFRRFGSYNPYLEYDLIIHARASVKYGTRQRNWVISEWGRFLDYVNRVCPDVEKIASIGIEAHHIPGTEDLREEPLDYLADVMASSRLFVGPACGPLFYGFLCGLPALTWAPNEKIPDLNCSHWERIKRVWNPFRTQNKYILRGGWQPDPEFIAKKVKSCLKDLKKLP